MAEGRFSASFARSLLRMITDPTFHDVTFVVGKERERVGCNKALLRVHCPVFEAMFTSAMLESSVAEMPLPGVDPIVFRTMLHWMVSDSLRLQSITCLQPLIALADYYQIQALLKAACHFVKASTITIHVVTDDILRALHGVDLGLCGKHCLRNSAMQVRILRDSSMADVCAAIAQKLAVDKSKLQLWRISHRKNGTVRPNKFLEDVSHKSSSTKEEAAASHSSRYFSLPSASGSLPRIGRPLAAESPATSEAADDTEDAEMAIIETGADVLMNDSDILELDEVNEVDTAAGHGVANTPLLTAAAGNLAAVRRAPVSRPLSAAKQAAGHWPPDDDSEEYEEIVTDYILYGVNSSGSRQSSVCSQAPGSGKRKHFDWQHFTGLRPSKAIFARVEGYGCGLESEISPMAGLSQVSQRTATGLREASGLDESDGGLDSETEMKQKSSESLGSGKCEALTPASSGCLPLTCLRRKDAHSNLLFLKYFDAYEQSMSIVGSLVLSEEASLADVASAVRRIAAWSALRDISLWEEEDAMKSKINALSLSQSLKDAQLVDGDIIVFQEKSALSPYMRLPSAHEFLKQLASEESDTRRASQPL